jgi:hypothetical protein
MKTGRRDAFASARLLRSGELGATLYRLARTRSEIDYER